MMMEPQERKAVLELGKFCEVMSFGPTEMTALRPVWEIASALAAGKEKFFDFDGMAHYCREGGLAPEIVSELAAVGEITNRTPALRLYAEALLYGLMSEKVPVGRMPYPTKLLGERDGLFMLLVTLATFEIAEETYRREGIPLKYLSDFARFFPGGVSMYAAGHGGRSGITPAQLSWMRNFALARKLRIGRFDYIPDRVLDYVPAVFRSRKTGELAVLCRDGWMLDAEGYRTNTESAVTARLEFAGRRVTGIPVSPLGHAVIGRTRTLDLDEFESAVTPWDCVPACHMAGGGGMTPEKVLASLREAKEFFRQYFHQDVRMFTCVSWVLNPEWEKEMPDSNIAKFQRMTYLTPGTSSGTDGLFFVFGTNTPDWANFAADTSLRRAFLRLHERGGVLRSGAMFVMAEDLDRLGDGFYRDRYRF